MSGNRNFLILCILPILFLLGACQKQSESLIDYCDCIEGDYRQLFLSMQDKGRSLFSTKGEDSGLILKMLDFYEKISNGKSGFPRLDETYCELLERNVMKRWFGELYVIRASILESDTVSTVMNNEEGMYQKCLLKTFGEKNDFLKGYISFNDMDGRTPVLVENLKIFMKENEMDEKDYDLMEIIVINEIFLRILVRGCYKDEIYPVREFLPAYDIQGVLQNKGNNK